MKPSETASAISWLPAAMPTGNSPSSRKARHEMPTWSMRMTVSIGGLRTRATEQGLPVCLNERLGVAVSQSRVQVVPQMGAKTEEE